MSSDTDAADPQTEASPGPESLHEIHSPYRPLPLGAKKALQEAAETVKFVDEDPRTAFVDSVPPEEVLEEWELEHVRHDTPEEVWETDTDQRVEIYIDRVEIDGREATLDPADAKQRARAQDHFSRID